MSATSRAALALPEIKVRVRVRVRVSPKPNPNPNLAREQREDGLLHALQQEREVLQRDEAVRVEVEQPEGRRHRLLALAPRTLGAGEQLGLVLAEDGGEDEVGQQEEAKDEEGHEEERREAVLLVCREHDVREVGGGEEHEEVEQRARHALEGGACALGREE